MTQIHTSRRIYIDRDDDRPVVRAVSVRPAFTAELKTPADRTYRDDASEATGARAPKGVRNLLRHRRDRSIRA